ncbi:MAG: NAD(P)/FAD-dependent oxidoreductase [Pyrinomonadaceae bacterium]
MKLKQKVTIIGAGLAGSLLAIYLARRDIEVNVYDARGDMRLAETAAGRSINLALSDRGIAALREVGMDEYMLSEAVPMYGRMIHSVKGDTKLLRYSGREGDYINSVSRAGLNIALINKAERYPGVKFIFNERCVDFDCRTGEAVFASGLQTGSDTAIATDGAGSAVRNAMQHGGVERFDLSQVWLEHGYKELHIPSVERRHHAGSDRELFSIEPNALHIWPRHKFMMIALPNFEGSFTCTLFLAHTSDDGGTAAFDQLIDEGSLVKFFEANFPDALELMPALTHDFFANPVGNLGTIKCFPWNVGGKALLLGDSAHAVVPFYGQGMNCAFEDVRVLDQIIDKNGTDWETVYEEYGRLRKVNTDAIADMAEENFYEMRDAVADPVFVRKRELETRLEQTYPDYFSKYSMVTFREDLPYSVAKQKGNAQDRFLMNVCAEHEDVRTIDLDWLHRQLSELDR